MQIEPVDIFLSAPQDASIVQRWATRLRTLGVTASTDSDLTECRALVLYLSDKLDAQDEQLEQLRVAQTMNVPTVIVSAAALDPADFNEPLTQVITADKTPLEVWQEVLTALHKLEAIHFDPKKSAISQEVCNEFRRETESKPEWRMAVLVTLVVAVACLCWWVYLKHGQQQRLRDQMGQPLLPAQPVAPPKAVPIVPSPTAGAEGSPSGMHVLPPERTEQALAIVQKCIEAGARDDGFTPTQIEAITDFFTDPVYIEGKGQQTTSALRASLTARQEEWPMWHENIAFIKVDEQVSTPDSIVVVVRSTYFAENKRSASSTTGALVTRYTVKFRAEDRPLVERVEAVALH